MRSLLILSLSLVFAFPCKGQSELPEMRFEQLDPRTTLITASYMVGEILVPANYLIIEGDSTSVLIDTPWDDEQTKKLLEWSRENLDKPISFAIITHSHIDRMGGIAELHRQGIETYIHPKAQELNAELGDFEPAIHLVEEEQTFDLNSIIIRVFYPGDGHAPGNLVVMVGRHGLYGGCFLKSAHSRNLGNLEDANLESWNDALERIQPFASNAAWVIPGHGPAVRGSFERTTTLVRDALNSQ